MSLTAELLAELQQVDADWQLIPCDDRKRPVNPASGEPMHDWAHHTYDADGIAEIADSPYVHAVGLVLGEPSGVIAVDFDGSGSVARFRQVFNCPWSNLPPTVGWTSGLPNRRQLAFRVPLDLWPELRGRRVVRGIEQYVAPRQAGQQAVDQHQGRAKVSGTDSRFHACSS